MIVSAISACHPTELLLASPVKKKPHCHNPITLYPMRIRFSESAIWIVPSFCSDFSLSLSAVLSSFFSVHQFKSVTPSKKKHKCESKCACFPHPLCSHPFIASCQFILHALLLSVLSFSRVSPRLNILLSLLLQHSLLIDSTTSTHEHL